jgi:hypothetical protein
MQTGRPAPGNQAGPGRKSRLLFPAINPINSNQKYLYQFSFLKNSIHRKDAKNAKVFFTIGGNPASGGIIKSAFPIL